MPVIYRTHGDEQRSFSRKMSWFKRYLYNRKLVLGGASVKVEDWKYNTGIYILPLFSNV